VAIRRKFVAIDPYDVECDSTLPCPHSWRRAAPFCVRDRLKAAAEGNFDQMLGTLAPDPNYRFWVEGDGFGNGPK